jgi:hypothetical protein
MGRTEGLRFSPAWSIKRTCRHRRSACGTAARRHVPLGGEERRLRGDSTGNVSGASTRSDRWVNWKGKSRS